MPRPARAPAPADVGDLQDFKAAFFKAIAHPTRIRLLEILVEGERSVQELQAALAVDQPVVSQHLAILRAGNIVVGRRTGASVRYAVRDPLIGELLRVARRIFDNDLLGRQQMLRQLRGETGRRRQS